MTIAPIKKMIEQIQKGQFLTIDQITVGVVAPAGASLSQGIFSFGVHHHVVFVKRHFFLLDVEAGGQQRC